MSLGANARSYVPMAGAVLLVLASTLPAAAAPRPQATPEPPVFGGRVELTTVDVLVLDRNGQPVPGLTREDFTVQEDGVAQSITSFEAVGFQESEPSVAPQDSFVSSNIGQPVRPERTFLVIYDDIHLTPLGGRLALAELEKLIDGLAPGDVVSVVTTARRASWIARLPEGRDELLAFARDAQPAKQLDLSTGRISDWEAMQISRRRDAQVLGVVARRYFENGLVVEMTAPQADRREYQRDLDVSYGLPLIQAKATEVYEAAAQRADAALEAMRRAIASLAVQRGRKAVLVLSEGFVYDSTQSELRDLVKEARGANAVLYFFDAKGRSGPNAPGNDAENWRALEERDFAQTVTNFSRDSEGTESAALDTGGRVVKGTDDLAKAMLQVVRESRSYYLLGYATTNTKRDGKFRTLKVSVARPDVDVRARKGYYAPRNADDKKAPPKDSVDPQVRAGLDSPFDRDRIPLRLASYVLGPSGAGKAGVLLVADLDLRHVPFETKGGRQVAALDSYVVVSSLGGGSGDAMEKRIDLSLPPEVLERVLKTGVPIMRNFELASGRYQARLFVRDQRSAIAGSVRHTFEVPPLTGLRLSTPVLSDALVPGDPGTQLPMPLAHRNFASGANLFYAFDLFGATPRNGQSEVQIGYVVRRKDGPVFAESPARTVTGSWDGTLSHRLTLPLNGAAPGEYELQLTVEDTVGGGRIERREAFVVDPA